MTERSENHWLSLIDSFHAAALGQHSWDAPLQELAGATGSRCGQLIVRQDDLTILFNTITNLDPGITKHVYDHQSINPRPPVVRKAPLLKVMGDWDIISPEQYRQDPFCQEILQPADVPYFCSTVLERRDGAFVTLAVLRSQADGYITTAQREAFGQLSVHVRAAVRMHLAIERNGIALLTGTMEALSIPAFVCDHTGRVQMLTPAAEVLVGFGTNLQLRNGRLHTSLPGESAALNDAVNAAASAATTRGPVLPRAIIVRSHDPDAPPLILDVFALPARSDEIALPNMTARALIVVRGPRATDSRRMAVLGAVYGLTAAETEIALRLAEGKSTEDIAAHRGVAVGTVRAQIKAIQAKVGVRRQAELTARLNQL